MDILIPLVFSFKRRGKTYDEIQKWFNIPDTLMPDIIRIVNKKMDEFNSIGSEVSQMKRGRRYDYNR